MFSELFRNLTKSLYITLAGVFSKNLNIIKVHNNENAKFFYKNFIIIALKSRKSFRNMETHNLIFEIVVSYLEDCFQFITFLNPYLKICICEIKLSETLSTTWMIE